MHLLFRIFKCVHERPLISRQDQPDFLLFFDQCRIKGYKFTLIILSQKLVPIFLRDLCPVPGAAVLRDQCDRPVLPVYTVIEISELILSDQHSQVIRRLTISLSIAFLSPAAVHGCQPS